MTNIKISELNPINKSDLQPDDIFLVVRDGQWDKVISHAQLFRLSTDNLVDGILPVERGGAGSDLSQTGGTRHYVKQLAEGAELTTGLIQTEDIPDRITSTHIGGSSSLSMGTTSSQVVIGSSYSNDYIYGMTCDLVCEDLTINSNSILLQGGAGNIEISDVQDIVIGGNVANIILAGTVSHSGKTIMGDTTLSGALNTNGAIVSQSLTSTTISSSAITTQSINAQELTMPQLVGQQLMYGNNGQVQMLGSTGDALVGYQNSGLTTYSGSQVAAFLGTNNIDGIARTSIKIAGTSVGAEPIINFIPTGLTMSAVDSGNQLDISMTLAATDNIASKLYLWSNYR